MAAYSIRRSKKCQERHNRKVHRKVYRKPAKSQLKVTEIKVICMSTILNHVYLQVDIIL